MVKESIPLSDPIFTEPERFPIEGFPQDALDPHKLQVTEHIRLVQEMLHRPQVEQGLEYVHSLGNKTLLGVGLYRNETIKGVIATPYHFLWQPDQSTYKDITRLPVWKSGERAELMTTRMQENVREFMASCHGFLGSRMATVPWQKRALDRLNNRHIASFGITWKGGEGTTPIFDYGHDPFTLEDGVDQVQKTIMGTGKDLGFAEKDWVKMFKAFWGHSYGGLLAFRHLLQYGRMFPYLSYGSITPVIMGASRSKNEWPDWLRDAAKIEKELLQNHVYVLDNSPFGRLVKLMGTMENPVLRNQILSIGEKSGLVNMLLKYYIGMDGYGGQEVLPVYLHSLRDYWYTVRDVRLLDTAPYIAGNETMARISPKNMHRFAMVIGGKKRPRKGDHVLASPHMNRFSAALETIASAKPKIIMDSNSPHHPRLGVIDQLIDFTLFTPI